MQRCSSYRPTNFIGIEHEYMQCGTPVVRQGDDCHHAKLLNCQTLHIPATLAVTVMHDKTTCCELGIKMSLKHIQEVTKPHSTCNEMAKRLAR